MNYTLAAADRGYNISFGDVFTSLMTGLSGAPYSKRHWELSNKCEPQYYLGHRTIAVLQAIPFFGGLIAIIERITVFIYNNFFYSSSDLSGDSTALSKPVIYVEPVLPINIPAYQSLRKKMKRWPISVYVTDETGKHQEQLSCVLGKGGSKKTILTESNHALILPNMDVDSNEEIAGRWERMVLEEVKMSEILNRLGLLSLLPEQVSITLDESSEQVIPAYICETFENLKLKYWFIIDTKNSASSTWKQGVDFLFRSDQERLDPKNWDSVLDSVLTDVAKICLYDIPVGCDSLNIAIVRKHSDFAICQSDFAICQYEVRYFGFHFSVRDEVLAIPDVENRSLTLPNIKKATQLLDNILDNIFFYEFGQRYDHGDEKEKTRFKAVKKELVEKSKEKIIARMNQEISAKA